MKSSNPTTFGSLFAGIGGWDLGLERAGWECKWQVEIDDYCNKVLEKHWPDVSRYRDVYGVSASSLETVDAICGGFPCQPFSKAGKRQGTSDPRWLWPEFARLVDEMGPTFVLVENVRELLGQGGVEVAADLAEMGYDYQWGVIPATAVGAPHLRERLFLVAYTNSNGLYGQRLYEEWTESFFFTTRSGRGSGDSKRVGTGSENEMAALPTKRNRWASEPGLGRVAHGVPNGVDRLKVLGNALMPQIAEAVGRSINEVF